MKFDTPATTNPIDQLKVIGKPVDRVDGRFKTTGTATYAYEWHDPDARVAYGYIVASAIPKGRIASMDLSAAKAASGVLAVVNAESAGKLDKGTPVTVEALVAAGVVSKPRDGVKILGVGELKTKLSFQVAGASKSAVAAIEKAGGSVTLLGAVAEA